MDAEVALDIVVAIPYTRPLDGSLGGLQYKGQPDFSHVGLHGIHSATIKKLSRAIRAKISDDTISDADVYQSARDVLEDVKVSERFGAVDRILDSEVDRMHRVINDIEAGGIKPSPRQIFVARDNMLRSIRRDEPIPDGYTRLKR